MSRLCPNLTPVPTVPDSVPSDITEAVVSALHEIIPVSDSQLEKIEMSHNSMVGHGRVLRTIEHLKGLEEQWLDMEHHVKDFIQNCACCQKMSVIKIPVHISFVSKSLSATQCKWSTIQKEAYAMYPCCKQLDSLIRDRKFRIFTDHKNLTFLSQDPSTMVSRWSIALQELDYSIEYIAGSKNHRSIP